MFSNFDDLFQEETNSIPKEIIAAFNDSTPKGLKYEYVKEDMYKLIPNSEEIMKISMKVELPSELQFSSKEELQEMLYRTQTYLKVKKNESIDINGLKINPEDLVISPLREMENFSIRIVPQSFPDPFTIIMKGNGVEQAFLIERQPFSHLKKSFFKSVDNNIIRISYIINEDENTINYNFDIELERSKTAQEIVDALNLYVALFQERAQIFDEKLPKLNQTEIDKDTMLNSLEYWKEICKIEEVLEQKFDISLPLSKEDMYKLDTLIVCLIKDLPYKRNLNITNLSTEVEGDFQKDNLINKEEFAINFLENEEYDLLGVKIKLNNAIGIFNLKVKDIIEDKINKNNIELIIERSADLEIYQSTKHFLEYNKAKKYLDDFESLRNAKYLNEL